MWKSYDPNKEAVLVRNPYFKVWNAGRAARGLPGRDRREVRPPGHRRGDRRSRTASADEVFDGDAIPADRLTEISTQVRRPGARERAHGRLVHGAEHREAAVQQPEGAAGHQLRGRPRGYVKIGGGSSLAVADLPDPAAELPRLRAILPVHRGRWRRPKWTAPDLAKAKQLVQESGTAGMKVVVNGTTTRPGKALGEQMVRRPEQRSATRPPRSCSDRQHPVPVRPELGQRQLERRLVGLVPGLPGPVGLPERAARLRDRSTRSDASPNIAEFCDKSHPGQDGPGRSRWA